MSRQGQEKHTRIVYIGAERVGLACLQRLVRMRKHIVGVFTAHDDLRPHIADFISFDDYTRTHGLCTIKVNSSKSPSFIRWVRALKPDLMLVVSWSQLIPEVMITSVPLGCVGLHYSLLPERRGGAPLNWAIMDGLRSSGITLFYMDGGLDTGDVIAQKRFAISRTDTVKTLLDKILVLAPDLLAEQIDFIERGVALRRKQDEARASYTKRRYPADSRIKRFDSKEDLYNFIRALAPPYPPAYTFVGRRKFVIPAARFEDGKLWLEGYLE